MRAIFCILYFVLLTNSYAQTVHTKLQGDWYLFHSELKNDSWGSYGNGKDTIESYSLSQSLLRFDSNTVYCRDIINDGESLRILYTLKGDSIYLGNHFTSATLELIGDTLISENYEHINKYVKIHLDDYKSIKHKLFHKLLKFSWNNEYHLTYLPDDPINNPYRPKYTSKYYLFDLDTVGQAYHYYADKKLLDSNISSRFSLEKVVDGRDFFFSLEHYDGRLFMFTLSSWLVVVEKIKKNKIITRKFYDKNFQGKIVFKKRKKK